MSNKLLIIVVVLSCFMMSCSTNQSEDKDWIADENIDMSDELLLSDESPLTEMPEYSKLRGGESDLIERSFENAPPLIPHKIAGLLPIRVNDNKCLTCHIPHNATKFGATAMPLTHFTSYRPFLTEEEGLVKVDAEDNVVVETDLEHFNLAMFNCSQCHVAQANVSAEIPNMFDPAFRQASERQQSNLKKVMKEGVK